jgi:hypothetical protein
LNIARIRALLALPLRANVRISEINASWLGRRCLEHCDHGVRRIHARYREAALDEIRCYRLTGSAAHVEDRPTWRDQKPVEPSQRLKQSSPLDGIQSAHWADEIEDEVAGHSHVLGSMTGAWA